MRHLARLWDWNCTIDRVPYLVLGIVLFLIKYVIDVCIATYAFAQSWSVMNYLIWPNDRTLRIFDLNRDERLFALSMLAVSLPFIWMGVTLTLQRLRATGLSRGMIVLFFVPLVNLLFFLLLIVLPSERPETVATADPLAADEAFMSERQIGAMRQLRQVHREFAGDSYWRSGLVSLLISLPMFLAAIMLAGEVLQSYGFSLFVGSPFALGMFSVLLFGFSRPQPLGACLAMAMLTSTLASLFILVFGLEGLICLLMATPILVPLVLLGATVGWAIQARPWLGEHTFAVMLAVTLALPALMAAEARHEPEPNLRSVSTEVIIDAPPDRVWPWVIAFPPLPEPDDWFFQTGIAYPRQAEIHGEGPGAVRYCVFSTGAFVEPIEVWQPPVLLRFRVAEQPAPMIEWSPYHIHPAHLDHYLVSVRGQFRLEPLEGGRTRLEGTTWYTNRMWPAAYWSLWTDHIIQRIHRRVLTHIQTLAEK